MQARFPPNPFLERMHANGRAFGTFVFSSDPAVTEMLGAAGFELAIVDTEHAPLTIADIVAHGRAATAANISWWVRVGRFDPSEIGKLLDAGAQGIVLPHFGLNADQSEAMIASFRYPPHGTRPTCTGTRAADYGLASFASYVGRANAEVMSVGLIEDASVIERVEELLQDSALDAIMPGGIGDLASSMGLHGQARHPRVVEAIRRVVKAAKATGRIKVGVYLSDLDAAADLVDLEPDFFVYSIDYKVVSSAYRAIRQSLGSRLEAEPRPSGSQVTATSSS
jgi:2-keto-3-deoxy-L-rhamnonate aldolase RhmA